MPEDPSRDADTVELPVISPARARPASRRSWRPALIAAGAVAMLGLVFAAGQASSPVADAANTSALAADADRMVCADLDARGGTYYHQFVAKVMGPRSGYQSVSVDVATLQRGIDDLELVGSTAPRAGAGTAASPALERERATMVSAAAAIGQLYANADTTTLLTAFVGSAVECSALGHQPTWFDANALSNGTAAGSTAGTATPATGSTSDAAPSPAALRPAAPSRPASTFTAGTYEVGTGPDQIAPGTYKATCSTNGYWARLGSTNSSDILDNDWKPNGGPMIVTVKKSDTAIELGDCTWTKTK